MVERELIKNILLCLKWKMNISKVKINIDFESVIYSNENEGFITNMNIDSGIYKFPQKRSKGRPAMILGHLLKEMRLLVGKKNTIKERHIYYFPLNGHYILLTLVDEGILSIRFAKRVVQENEMIIHTIYSDEGLTINTTIHCLFDEFFMESYRQAEQFYQVFKDSPTISGEMFVLANELNSSKKILNKIV